MTTAQVVTSNQQEDPAHDDSAIIALLEHRYGDGLVYLREDGEGRVYDMAVTQGYINAEGYLTPKGRSLVARSEPV